MYLTRLKAEIVLLFSLREDAYGLIVQRIIEVRIEIAALKNFNELTFSRISHRAHSLKASSLF
jgi:hypothetical protein